MDLGATPRSLPFLQKTAQKIALLRELCKVLGVVIEAREYFLENEQVFPGFEQVPTYEWLPFQA